MTSGRAPGRPAVVGVSSAFGPWMSRSAEELVRRTNSASAAAAPAGDTIAGVPTLSLVRRGGVVVVVGVSAGGGVTATAGSSTLALAPGAPALPLADVFANAGDDVAAGGRSPGDSPLSGDAVGIVISGTSAIIGDAAALAATSAAAGGKLGFCDPATLWGVAGPGECVYVPSAMAVSIMRYMEVAASTSRSWSKRRSASSFRAPKSRLNVAKFSFRLAVVLRRRRSDAVRFSDPDSELFRWDDGDGLASSTVSGFGERRAAALFAVNELLALCMLLLAPSGGRVPGAPEEAAFGELSDIPRAGRDE
mmetsp:Transcript_19488/g.60521  ORF Transcript_19488/g.60521 Transcript_19488/m.60521 type:complete len:307 (+) Transcript_19488:526-1446(+)